MVIDFHTHCFADNIAANAISLLEKQANIKAVAGGTAAILRNHMRVSGVNKSVVLPVATKPSQVNAINVWAMQNNDNLLTCFGAVHPDDPDFEQTVKMLKENGFRGVKFHPDYQRFYVDEPRMMPLYEMLRDAGLIVVFHSGVDIGFPSPVYCTPLMLSHVLNNVPGICVVAAHMGAHALWNDVEELLAGRSVFFDTSYSHYLLKNHGMERLINKHGAEKILFGSDFPWMDPHEEIENIHSLALPASDIDKILFGNALSLLSAR